MATAEKTGAKVRKIIQNTKLKIQNYAKNTKKSIKSDFSPENPDNPDRYAHPEPCGEEDVKAG